VKKKRKGKRKSKLAEASRKRFEDDLSKTPARGMFRCLNCGYLYMADAGPSSCPNPRCSSIDGRDHPGNEEDRGTYVEWINYESLFGSR